MPKNKLLRKGAKNIPRGGGHKMGGGQMIYPQMGESRCNCKFLGLCKFAKNGLSEALSWCIEIFEITNHKITNYYKGR